MEPTLARRLRLEPGTPIFVGAAPYPPSGARIGSILDAFPRAKHLREAGVALFFTSKHATLEDTLPMLTQATHPDSVIWVAWPKETSPEHELLENDLSPEDVLRIGAAAGLASDDSCSIGENWQAVRFVRSSAEG